MTIFSSYPESIGNTPLVQLNRVAGSAARVLAKVESRNPSFSVKCRLGAALIEDGEKRGLLRPGGHIVEPTSGNTGIALAYVAAAKGYKLTLTMPETMSIERRKLLTFLGAHLVLTPGAKGMTGAVHEAEAMAMADSSIFLPQQFSNPANALVHQRTTGPEIWRDTEGRIDAFVAGVGTGGTFTGVTRHIKQDMGKAITAVAVEPAQSPVISQQRAGQPLQPSAHPIQGIGAGFVPAVLDMSLIDRVEQVGGEEAIAMARRLAREEGILAGISSGAAVVAASRLAHAPGFAGKTIVVILPDTAERYLSTALFEE